MDHNTDFAIAVDFINSKIAELNIKISSNKTEELDEELNKWLGIQKQVYDGNKEMIKKLIDGEIK